jgi:hypothetical protein
MRALRQQYTEAGGPLVLLGIITNSDPRVRLVLEDLKLRLGVTEDRNMMTKSRQSVSEYLSLSRHQARQGMNPELFRTPMFKALDTQNDFDFLVTSYTAGAEKPDEAIWRFASSLSEILVISRSEQSWRPDANVDWLQAHYKNLQYAFRYTAKEVGWIHIGDEAIKDIKGAEAAGYEALYLDRSGKGDGEVEKSKTISSLSEAAMAINIMVQSVLRKHQEIDGTR